MLAIEAQTHAIAVDIHGQGIVHTAGFIWLARKRV